MLALEAGFNQVGRRSRLIYSGIPPLDHHPIIVWGQAWTSERVFPQAIASGRPFWYIDNGYWKSARGGAKGYYRFTYRGMSPTDMADPPDDERFRAMGVKVAPWREDGDHVVLAMPSPFYGKAIGLDLPSWISRIEFRLRKATSRKIIIRNKSTHRPLADDLKGAWALVTHSSNSAFEAVIAGIPVFVEPTAGAAAMGRTDLRIEHPIFPDRTKWLRSLMCQQYTIDEMRVGIAQRYMKMITDQVDGEGTWQRDASEDRALGLARGSSHSPRNYPAVAAPHLASRVK